MHGRVSITKPQLSFTSSCPAPAKQSSSKFCQSIFRFWNLFLFLFRRVQRWKFAIWNYFNFGRRNITSNVSKRFHPDDDQHGQDDWCSARRPRRNKRPTAGTVKSGQVLSEWISMGGHNEAVIVLKERTAIKKNDSWTSKRFAFRHCMKKTGIHSRKDLRLKRLILNVKNGPYSIHFIYIYIFI